MAPPDHTLTGVWDGEYSYPRTFQPTAFTAVLFEFAARLTGTIHEQPTDGPHAGTLTVASVDGGRSGSIVHFVKTYDPDGGKARRPVHYEGLINEGCTEIEGRWSFPNGWSGKFVMIRSGRDDVAVATETSEVLPAL